MSLLDRIAACNAHDLDGFLPFEIEGATVGWIKRAFAARLAGLGNVFEVSGNQIGAGEHTIKVMKKGKGAAYLSTVTTFFTKEEDIKGAGLELRIEDLLQRVAPLVEELEHVTAPCRLGRRWPAWGSTP